MDSPAVQWRRRSAEILRRKPSASRTTPLPQDDKGLRSRKERTALCGGGGCRHDYVRVRTMRIVSLRTVCQFAPRPPVGHILFANAIVFTVLGGQLGRASTRWLAAPGTGDHCAETSN